MEIGITKESTAGVESDCSLNEKIMSHKHGVFESRLKCTDDNDKTGQGSRGWGFWNHGDGYHFDAVWFFSCSSESDPAVQKLQAMVVNSGTITFKKIVNIDMSKWHTYRVEMLPAKTVYYVDETEVASTDETIKSDLPLQALWWIDNKKVFFEDGKYGIEFINVHQDQKMYIDWIKFYAVR